MTKITPSRTISIASHVHSEWSYDATWPLEKIASVFARKGHRVVLMTEHDQGYTEERRQEHRKACEAASTQDILLLPGIEYADADNTVHVLVWGDVPFAGERTPTLDMLAHVCAHGGVAVLAHPTRKNAWKRVQPAWVEHLAGIELWNRKSDGWCASVDGARLIAQTELPAWVGLDFHRPRQFFPLSMRMRIDSAHTVTEEHVLDAIRAGELRPRAIGFDALRYRSGPFRWASVAADTTRKSVLRFIRRRGRKHP